MEAGRRSRAGWGTSRSGEMGAGMPLRARLAVSRETATRSGERNIKRPETATMSQTPGKLGKGCFRQNLLSMLWQLVPVITTNYFHRMCIVRVQRLKLHQQNLAWGRGERNLPGHVRTWGTSPELV